MRTIALIILLAFTWTARATLTLVQRETFQSVGSLDSGTPGNLGTVTAGTFYKRAVGPRLSSDTTANSLGWSADPHRVVIVEHEVTITATAAASIGMYTAWYYVDSFSNNGANKQYILSTKLSNGNQLLFLLMDGTTGNFWYNRAGLWTDTDSTVSVPVRQWFELRQSWQDLGSGNFNISAAFRLSGSSTWTTIYAANSFNAGGFLQKVEGCKPNTSSSNGAFNGRYGMPSMYGLSSFTERTNLVSDVVDPPSGPFNWYANPSTGSDNNDGVSSSSPWQTIDKIVVESANCGMFSRTNYSIGDSLEIDTSGSNLVLGTNYLNIQTRGLTVRPPSSQTFVRLTAEKTISSGSWSLSSGLTKVYETTDTQASIVLWENDKWLDHPTGATWASVSNSVQTTAGSFWTDGTKLYCHPFGDTNPGSDGKTYTRSYARSSLNASAIIAGESNLYLKGLWCWKTCISDKATGSSGANYVLSWTGGNGTSVIDGGFFAYGGNHCVGMLNLATAETVNLYNVQVEQCSPYAGGGGTAFVSYSGTAAVATNVHNYIGCTNLANIGAIGSTTGDTNYVSSQSFYSHNQSGSNQFSLITFQNCSFSGLISAANSVSAIIITNSSFGGGIVNATNTTVDRCRITTGVGNGAVGQVMTVRNSIFSWASNLAWTTGAGGWRPAIGTLTFEGNTVDATTAPAPVGSNFNGFFARSGALNATVRNNIFIFDPAYTFTVISDATSTDALNFSNNVYRLGSGALVAGSYNDGMTTANRSLTQWQALGNDAGTVNSNPCLRYDYRPQPWSNTRNSGVNLGPMVDYSGKLFPIRKGIGAYEWQVYNPHFQFGIRR